MTAVTMQGWMKSIAVFAMLVIVATQLGNGCVSDDGGSSDDYRPSPSRPDDRYDYNDRIPRDAQLIEEGRDTLRYRAEQDGRVYAYDADARRVLGSYDISRGREFIVSPKDSRAWIDDKRVLDYNFDRDHIHRIYFLPDRNDRGEPARPEPTKPQPAKPQPTKPTPEPVGPVFGGGAGATVPKSASIAREGKGTDLSFEAAGVGTVYIYDVENKTTLATYNLKKGQRFTVSPLTGEAAVDGKVVIRKQMSTKRTYRLYFNLNV
jgi:hypothetical protein